MRRQLAMADPITAEFRGLFDQASAICAKLLVLEERSPEKSAKQLRAALASLGQSLINGGVCK